VHRAPAWLFTLLSATFVLYTDDYVIAGILPELAHDLNVSEGQAGQLVTVFSLTVAVAAPVAAVAFARLPRRPLFVVALLVFAGANLTAAATPSFTVLLGLRVVAAAAAASMTPAAFAFAAMHAPKGRAGRYIAVVSLGVTGSIAAGVPLGTWIGGALGWRATFVTASAAGLCVLVAALATLPRRHRLEDVPRLGEQLRTLRRPAISLGLLANTALMTGSMMMLTYLAPYLAEAAAAGVNERAFVFGLSGCAGILGIWLGGSATDRWGPDRTLTFGIGVFLATMLGLWGLWLLRPAPAPLIYAVAAVWGGIAFWNSPAIQARLHILAGPVAPQALALNTSGTYLGVAIGGAVGGTTLASVGVGALPLVAAVFGTSAIVLLLSANRASDPHDSRTASRQYR
jgi:predicted MFS family arabinose efflux permease